MLQPIDGKEQRRRVSKKADFSQSDLADELDEWIAALGSHSVRKMLRSSSPKGLRAGLGHLSRSQWVYPTDMTT